MQCFTDPNAKLHIPRVDKQDNRLPLHIKRAPGYDSDGRPNYSITNLSIPSNELAPIVPDPAGTYGNPTVTVNSQGIITQIQSGSIPSLALSTNRMYVGDGNGLAQDCRINGDITVTYTSQNNGVMTIEPGAVSFGKTTGIAGLYPTNGGTLDHLAKFTPDGTHIGDSVIAVDTVGGIGSPYFQVSVDNNNYIHIGNNVDVITPIKDTITIGRESGKNQTGIESVIIGTFSGINHTAGSSVAIGYNSGNEQTGENTIAIGRASGIRQSGKDAIAIGRISGYEQTGKNTIAIGANAGFKQSGNDGIAIGYNSGNTQTGHNNIAIGEYAGYLQTSRSIAIGRGSDKISQGSDCVSIGNSAHVDGTQKNNSIIINASGTPLSIIPAASSLSISPIRSDDGSIVVTDSYLTYSSTTKEVAYKTNTGGKPFVIDHPDDEDKHLVHVCLEGPEAGVYYRGKSRILEGQKFQMIHLPDYVRNLASDFTVHVTAILDDDEEPRLINATRVNDNKFKAVGSPGEFDWLVFAKRFDIEVEPFKKDSVVQGDGPYTWLA